MHAPFPHGSMEASAQAYIAHYMEQSQGANDSGNITDVGVLRVKKMPDNWTGFAICMKAPVEEHHLARLVAGPDAPSVGVTKRWFEFTISPPHHFPNVRAVAAMMILNQTNMAQAPPTPPGWA